MDAVPVGPPMPIIAWPGPGWPPAARNGQEWSGRVGGGLRLPDVLLVDGGRIRARAAGAGRLRGPTPTPRRLDQAEPQHVGQAVGRLHPDVPLLVEEPLDHPGVDPGIPAEGI